MNIMQLVHPKGKLKILFMNWGICQSNVKILHFLSHGHFGTGLPMVLAGLRRKNSKGGPQPVPTPPLSTLMHPV